MDQPGRVASPARGQLIQGKCFFSCVHSRLRIWSRETGSSVASRVSPLILHALRLNHQSSIINHQSSIIDHLSSIIYHLSSIINRQSSIINHQSSIINHQSSIINLVLTHGLLPPAFRRRHRPSPIVHLFVPSTAIGSVPSFLSGQANAYRWRPLPRVRRHRASSPPQGSLSNRCCKFHVSPWTNFCAPLYSPTNYLL